jgi:hypothetical protein
MNFLQVKDYATPKNAEAWINEAVRRLRKQGVLAKEDNTEDGSCANITTDGRRCVVGGMLDDSELAVVISEGWKHNGASALLQGMLHDKNYRAQNWVYAFQKCHDASTSMAEFEERIRKFAREYKITINPI